MEFFRNTKSGEVSLRYIKMYPTIPQLFIPQFHKPNIITFQLADNPNHFADYFLKWRNLKLLLVSDSNLSITSKC